MNSTSENIPQRREFPWGICIGALTSSGDDRNCQAMLPTAPGGLLVRFGLSGQAEAVRLLETAALSIVDTLPHRGVELHVVDFSIRKRFPNLSELAPFRQYRLFANRREADAALDEIEALARYRHQDILTDGTPTLSDHNRDSSGFEPYRLLILNLNDYPGDDAKGSERLLKVMDAAFDAGIYLLAYVNTDTLTPPPTDRQNPPPPFWTLLAQRYPEMLLTGEATIEMLPHKHTQPLLDALATSELELATPRVDLCSVLERCRQLAARDTGRLRDFLEVPVGFTPSGRTGVSFRLGAKSECNSAFIVGMTGSGKTTLLNHLICGISERYTSDEIRLFLMDYKDGVEFQAFATHPNCAKIFLDNTDLGAATRMVEELREEISKRNALFPTVKARDIDDYNEKSATKMPRLLLIVDEVQNLFSGKTGYYLGDLLEKVVRLGRSAGVHILLTTQTVGGVDIPPGLMSQIPLRISLRLGSENECWKIFTSYNNTAPLKLATLEFVYNPRFGEKDQNILGKSFEPLSITAIEERIAKTRANRLPSQCITPTMAKSPPQSTEQKDEPDLVADFQNRGFSDAELEDLITSASEIDELSGGIASARKD